ncbi:NCS2 family permease [Harryflintia acetispora]|uniref:AGZA family xanthine/uracil permease-like MFS transporter n=1 Tax=Harryflintia acetispora TaxID=1849041 RepID=A0A9X8UK89_9FIRM|nr:NCS2 family permease [Harryflintia acetispora]TCL44453.1 AGZA family xanthine/uracil permease-like MFS transporter [Harryflintia acetispora]
MLERFFGLKEHGTTVRTEIIAGITTFVTMAYIIFVNPNMLSTGAAATGSDQQAVFNGVFFATCLSAFIGTALMGLLARVPFAQAPGMGLNAFFTFTVMIGMQIAYPQALAIVFISGCLFIIITVFGLREAIIRAIPKNIRIAISAGIGLFLAFVGLQGAGLVANSDSTLVNLVDFSKMSDPEMRTTVIGAIIAFLGIVIIAALSKLNVKGSILIGIVVCTILGIPFGITQLPENFTMNFGQQFHDFTTTSFLALDFGGLFANTTSVIEGIFTITMIVISFSLVDMFDTIGTLLGTARKAGMLDDNGQMPRMKQALLCDAIATTSGALLGTSTVTTYVESTAGVAEGGRTGLTACTTAVLFLVACIFAPVVGIIPGVATAPALIYVGGLMISSIKDLETEDMSEAIPAFLCIALMPLTYSIANGIAFALISYVLIKLISGQFKDIRVITVVLSVLFVIRYLLMSL